jgi:hypothetical protein
MLDMSKENIDINEKLTVDLEGTESKGDKLILKEVGTLRNPWPWTMGMAGLVKWLSWQTENILGMSKSMLINQAVLESIKVCNDGVEPPEAELKSARRKVAEKLKKDPKWKRPREIQRHLRVKTEDYLNKEFDIFVSLLPDRALNDYFSSHFHMISDGAWQVYGNSNDFEYSTGIRFMQMDTLAYSADSNTLVALEQKVDAPIGEDQILKYCYMVAYMEIKKLIAPNACFKLLFISAERIGQEHLLEDAKNEIDTCPLPKRGTSEEEMGALKPRVRELLSQMELVCTTWRELGAHFADTLGRTPKGDGIYHKLVDGFLWSLSIKEGKQGKLYEKS